MADQTAPAVTVPPIVNYRIRFVVDEGARFEESNGKSEPLSEEEYRENSYQGCPDHPRAGSKALEGVATAPDTAPLVGCAICSRTDYQEIPYAEYLAYYGNPERHVYVCAEIQRKCPCCKHWEHAGGSCGIDFMDDAPELRALDRWFAADAIHQLPGYLREIAEQDLHEARA